MQTQGMQLLDSGGMPTAWPMTTLGSLAMPIPMMGDSDTERSAQRARKTLEKFGVDWTQELTPERRAQIEPLPTTLTSGKPMAKKGPSQSGYVGVSHGRGSRWQAQVDHRSIGGYATAYDAGVAVTTVLIELAQGIKMPGPGPKGKTKRSKGSHAGQDVIQTTWATAIAEPTSMVTAHATAVPMGHHAMQAWPSADMSALLHQQYAAALMAGVGQPTFTYAVNPLYFGGGALAPTVMACAMAEQPSQAAVSAAIAAAQLLKDVPVGDFGSVGEQPGTPLHPIEDDAEVAVEVMLPPPPLSPSPSPVRSMTPHVLCCATVGVSPECLNYRLPRTHAHRQAVYAPPPTHTHPVRSL